MNDILIDIIEKFLPNVDKRSVKIEEVSIGLINKTYKIEDGISSYILQRLNTEVFHQPEVIQNNFRLVRKHLIESEYPREVLEFLTLQNGSQLLFYENGVWRMSKCIEAENYTSINSPVMSRNAAEALAEFHYYLRDLDAIIIQDPIPEFCNLSFRIQEFENAVKYGNDIRKIRTKQLIGQLKSNIPFLLDYINIMNSLPSRIIHGDPKISNFLFRIKSNQVLSIIDMDTLMNGSISYDFGDMVRSFANTSKEDEKSAEKKLDPLIYEEVLEGYLSIGRRFLSDKEIRYLPNAALSIALIQSMRFLSDYLNMDTYYQVNDPEQNLNRAHNQFIFYKELKVYLNI